MELLLDLLAETEELLLENSRDTVEVTGLSEKDADNLMNALNKYDVRKAAVISRDKPVTYTLHFRNK